MWTGRGRLSFARQSERRRDRPDRLRRRPRRRRSGRRAPDPRRLPGLPRLHRARPRAPSAANQTAWNQDVSKAPVSGRSSAYINRITTLGGNQVVHPDFGGKRRLRDPVHDRRPQPASGPGQGHRRIRTRATSGPRRSRPTRPVEGGSDRHVLVLQRQSCVLFEMFAAHYVGGTGHRWTAASTARFDLGSARRFATRAGPRPTRRDCRSSPGSSATARSSRGQRAPRDPRHLLGDAARLHPPRHPLRLRPLRPEPAADGPAAAALERLLPRQPRPLPGGQPVAGDLRGPLPLRDHQRRQRRQRAPTGSSPAPAPSAGRTATSIASRACRARAFVVVKSQAAARRPAERRRASRSPSS